LGSRAELTPAELLQAGRTDQCYSPSADPAKTHGRTKEGMTAKKQTIPEIMKNVTDQSPVRFKQLHQLNALGVRRD
jgi:hypothetical protein